MIDLEKLSTLYIAAHDATKSPAQRLKATELLAEIDADKVVAEFLSLPENVWEDDGKHPRGGQPKYQNFEELANWIVSCAAWTPDESQDADAYREKLKAAKLAWTPDPSSAFHARMDRLMADKLGVVIRARKLAAAQERRTCDCDYTTIFGDQFRLGVRWCVDQPPHSPKEIKV
jgi:hypothetical protein